MLSHSVALAGPFPEEFMLSEGRAHMVADETQRCPTSKQNMGSSASFAADSTPRLLPRSAFLTGSESSVQANSCRAEYRPLQNRAAIGSIDWWSEVGTHHTDASPIQKGLMIEGQNPSGTGFDLLHLKPDVERLIPWSSNRHESIAIGGRDPRRNQHHRQETQPASFGPSLIPRHRVVSSLKKWLLGRHHNNHDMQTVMPAGWPSCTCWSAQHCA